MSRENILDYNEEQLHLRQQQFATLISDHDHRVTPDQLFGLRFCETCGGYDYQWTDWSMTEIDPSFLADNLVSVRIMEKLVRAYREYLLDSRCEDCEGTGFQGGNWDLEIEDWLKLGAIK